VTRRPSTPTSSPNERRDSPAPPVSSGLRSDAWLGGDDEVALNHQAALRAAGFRRTAGSRAAGSRGAGSWGAGSRAAGSRGRRSRGRPLIGIACTASDLNRCDLGLTALAGAVRRDGQPAYGLYVGDGRTPEFRAYGMVVLTLEGDRISGITRFVDNSLMSWFGLPGSLAE
jgi:hypothetical protein